MKKLKSNRYEKAVNEIKNLDENLSGKINEEILQSDKEYFHVAMIKISERQGQVKNDVSVVTQKFGDIQFEKLQKNYQFLGFNKLILTHDPRLNIQDEVVASLPTKSKEEVDAEMELEIEARVNERMKAEKSKEEVEKVYGNTAKEMKAFAETNEIDLTGLIKKEDIEGAILSWIEFNK